MTRKWEKYKEFLMTGHWHIHTNFTDGHNSVMEYAQKASKLRIPLIAFTEHVRKNLTYDFSEFLKQIEYARKAFPELVILSGCEAKVLPEGSIDCSQWILEGVDFKLFAFHSFPADVAIYLDALYKVIHSGQCDAWAHPGLFFKKNPTLSLSDEQLKAVFKLVEKNNILIEINERYNLPSQHWLKIIKDTINKDLFVRGSDVHSVEMIRTYPQTPIIGVFNATNDVF
jgi:DNA polymerase (family 10)/putative hydrolase